MCGDLARLDTLRGYCATAAGYSVLYGEIMCVNGVCSLERWMERYAGRIIKLIPGTNILHRKLQVQIT